MEFAISSIVLLLLMMGLLDLSRAFYFSVNLQGAAREGARHGAWFNTAARANLYLDDADIMSAVNSGLSGSGLVGTFVPSFTCLTPADLNSYNNKPYAASAYPTTSQGVNVYICYTPPNGGAQTGTMPNHPTDNSWRLGDINDETRSELENDLNMVGSPLMGLIRSTRTMPLVLPAIALAAGLVIGHFFQ